MSRIISHEPALSSFRCTASSTLLWRNRASFPEYFSRPPRELSRFLFPRSTESASCVQRRVQTRAFIPQLDAYSDALTNRASDGPVRQPQNGGGKHAPREISTLELNGGSFNSFRSAAALPLSLPLVSRPPSDLPYTICFSLISSLLVNFCTFMTSLSLISMLYSSFEIPMLEKVIFHLQDWFLLGSWESGLSDLQAGL